MLRQLFQFHLSELCGFVSLETHWVSITHDFSASQKASCHWALSPAIPESKESKSGWFGHFSLTHQLRLWMGPQDRCHLKLPSKRENENRGTGCSSQNRPKARGPKFLSWVGQTCGLSRPFPRAANPHGHQRRLVLNCFRFPILPTPKPRPTSPLSS